MSPRPERRRALTEALEDLDRYRSGSPRRCPARSRSGPRRRSGRGYTLAVTLGSPLLYVGDDFTETEVVPARP